MRFGRALAKKAINQPFAHSVCLISQQERPRTGCNTADYGRDAMRVDWSKGKRLGLVSLDRRSVNPGHRPRGAADSSCARSDGVTIYARGAEAAADERLRTVGYRGNAGGLEILLVTKSASGLREP